MTIKSIVFIFALGGFISLHATLPKDLVSAIEKGNIKEIKTILEYEAFTLADRALLIELAQAKLNQMGHEVLLNKGFSSGIFLIALIVSAQFLHLAHEGTIKSKTFSFHGVCAHHKATLREMYQNDSTTPIQPPNRSVREEKSYAGNLAALWDSGLEFTNFIKAEAWKYPKIAAISLPLLGIALYCFNSYQTKRYNDALTIKALLHEVKIKTQ